MSDEETPNCPECGNSLVPAAADAGPIVGEGQPGTLVAEIPSGWSCANENCAVNTVDLAPANEDEDIPPHMRPGSMGGDNGGA